MLFQSMYPKFVCFIWGENRGECTVNIPLTVQIVQIAIEGKDLILKFRYGFYYVQKKMYLIP